jgi:hypothetical protein
LVRELGEDKKYLGNLKTPAKRVGESMLPPSPFD